MKCLGNQLSKCNVNVHMFYIKVMKVMCRTLAMTGLNNVRFDEGMLGYQVFQKKSEIKQGT